MTPASYPLNLYRGDTGRWQYVLWDDVGKTQATDLTGVAAKAEIRERPGGESITELTCSITLPNTIDVVLAASDCQLLPSRGAWDLQLTFPSGDVNTIVAGPVTVASDVTDSTSSARRARQR